MAARLGATAIMAALAAPVVGLVGAVSCAGAAPIGGSTPASRASTVQPPGNATPPVRPAFEAADAGATAEGAGGSMAEVSVAPLGDQATGQAAPRGAPASRCREQPPQDFLIRGNFLKEGAAGNERAIQYRTDTYGYFKGHGRPGPGAKPPSAFVETTTFMGLPVTMHRKVVPALACVQEEIERACAAHPYEPHALAGIRFRNTYRGGEVTNHAYGIAIDVDPGQNSCCGCVKPWSDAEACRRPAATEYDRMNMPECWVHAFERFGFYWLGHDKLRDTMHFEFLGDPDRILLPASDAPRPASTATSGPDGGR